MWRAIGVPFHGDGGHADDRTGGEALFQLVVLRLTFGQAKPPAIVVNHDGDMVWIVEGGRAAVEGGVVELPIRGSDLPDELGEFTPVFFVALLAALGGEVELIPPF